MDNSEANKRIAKNTVYNYVRLGVSVLVGLYTSRLVLQILGVSDFGLYGVVGGLLATYAFISSSLSAATTRFINFEMGKENANLNRIFNICLTMHVVFAALILILSETIGIWYINNYLNVAPRKEGDAMFVFQISTIAACIGIINTPHQGLFTAFERFKEISIIDIATTLLKLALILLMLKLKGNMLRIYSIFMCAVTLGSFIAYRTLAHKYWKDIIKHKFYKEKTIFKDILSFTNYNILSSASIMARDSGSNILINFFFNTAVNGAYAIAKTVNTFLNTFIANIDIAAGPQIVQNYSAGNKERYTSIINNLNRYTILAAIAVCLPLFVELEGILQIWLKTVPEHTVIFCQMILLMVLVSSTSSGFPQLANASGRIKWFKILSSIIYLICLPIGFLLFKNGFEAWWILFLFVLADAIWRIVQYALSSRILGYDIGGYLKSVYPRVLTVLALCILFAFVYRHLAFTKIWERVTGFTVTMVFSCATVYYIGLYKEERSRLMSFLKKKLCR